MVFGRLTRQIWDDLHVRFPCQRKTQRDKLAVLVATMLQVKSANLMELGSGLPIGTTDALSRFQWIKRFPGNDLVDIDVVMGRFSREALALASADGAQPVLIIDQSTITRLERHELVMVALRVGKRAIAWRVYKARGSSEWREQSEVLEVASSFLPDGCNRFSWEIVSTAMPTSFHGAGRSAGRIACGPRDQCFWRKNRMPRRPMTASSARFGTRVSFGSKTRT